MAINLFKVNDVGHWPCSVCSQDVDVVEVQDVFLCENCASNVLLTFNHARGVPDIGVSGLSGNIITKDDIDG